MDRVTCFVNCFVLLMPTFAGNIDTEWPVIFNGVGHSYFGFNVGIHKNSKGSFALISATKANSTIPDRRSLHQPGVLYKCNISSTTTCEEVVEAIVPSGIRKKAVPKEDNSWLGVSLSVQQEGEKYIVACGHLWKYQLPTGDHPVGNCYVIDKDFSSSKLLSPVSSGEADTEPYSYLQAGSSATFDEDGHLLLGAAGCKMWSGGVITTEIPGYDMREIFPLRLSVYPREGEFAGYSISSGVFFESKERHIVTGAPRGGYYKGRVYLLERKRSRQRKFVSLLTLEGENVGDYFGASVLGIDINNDSYTDLLVGAPFYSQRSGGDEGKVYVYISNGTSLEKKQELMGSQSSGSRFGTAIANAGDIDKDGFTDVAIGAPYEDNAGAVYIYHGSPSGLSSNYSQKIDPAGIGPRPMGFGISIFGGIDVDDNGHPDLMVGSYLSDKAFLFRTLPSVKLHFNISFDPPLIPRNRSSCVFDREPVPCFNITYCLSFEGKHVSPQLDFLTELTSARSSSHSQKRNYLVYNNKLSHVLREGLTITKGISTCVEKVAYIKSDPLDFHTPIVITLSVNLTLGTKDRDTFCKSCPVLDRRSPSRLAKTIVFEGKCSQKKDHVCRSDLKLNASVSGLSNGKVIAGEKNELTLKMELRNENDPADKSQIHISLTPSVQIVSIKNCREQSQGNITCEGGDPLEAGSIVKHSITFDTSEVSEELDHVSINVTATSLSQELNETDNEVQISIPITTLADITIIGNPDVKEIMFDERQENPECAYIAHTYMVVKFLPSPIKSVSVDLLIPTALSENGAEFLQLNESDVFDGSGSLVTASCEWHQSRVKRNKSLPEGETNGSFYTSTRETLQIGIKPEPDATKRSAHSNDEDKTKVVLDCSNSKCTNVSCVAGPFKKQDDVAIFRIQGLINIKLLEKFLENSENITLRTQGKVRISDHTKDIQPTGHRPDETKVSTVIRRTTPPPIKKVPLWVYILSILVGVALLVAIILTLIKLGFFRRKKKEDMQNAKAKAKPDSSQK